MYKIHSTSQSVIFCCSQLEMFHKTHITSISDFLLSSTWYVSQDSYHFNQWFPVVLKLRCFTRFISLQSVISYCPQIEMFHKIHITSVSDFLLSSTWDVSQDSYHFIQWFPCVLNLRSFTRFISLQSVISYCPQIEMFHKIHITSISDFLLSSTWDLSKVLSLQPVISYCPQLEIFQKSYHFSQWFPVVLKLKCFTRFISLQSVISYCSQLEIFQKSYHFNQWFPIVLNLRCFTRFISLQSVISCCPQIEIFHKIHITLISDFLLSSTWDVSQVLSLQSVISCCPQLEIFHKSYHFYQWFPIVLNLRSFKSLITSVSDFLLSSTWDLSKVLSLQSVISYCPQLEMFHKIHITSISDFLLSSNWNVSQVLSLQSVISYCPQLEMFHKIYITSFSDFQLSSNWNVSQDSYHFYQWFPIVLNLRSFTSLITSISDFLLSSTWDLSQDLYMYHFIQWFPAVLKLKCFAGCISLQPVISCCPQIEIFRNKHMSSPVIYCCSQLEMLQNSHITSFSDFLLSSTWDISQDAYLFNQ